MIESQFIIFTIFYFSLLCVAFSKIGNYCTDPGDSIILRFTQIGLLMVHFSSDMPLNAAAYAVEKLKIPT